MIDFILIGDFKKADVKKIDPLIIYRVPNQELISDLEWIINSFFRIKN